MGKTTPVIQLPDGLGELFRTLYLSERGECVPEHLVGESRIYPALMHPATVLYVARNVAHLEQPPNLLEFFEKMRETMEDTCMKVLSKRNKEDGRIGYIVVVVGGAVRGLVEKGELTDEEGYRKMVAELEEEFVGEGIVGEPSVTTSEEWQRYETRGDLPAD